MLRIFCLSIFCFSVLSASSAHDVWLQTNTAIVRLNDGINIDLMLGNHGNDHRDFKLASKVGVDKVQQLVVITPDGSKHDLKPALVDVGYTPKEGFHSARYVTSTPGMHIAAMASDGVVNHGKMVRVKRSAKAFFLVSPKLDKLVESGGFDKALGHVIELIAEANLITPMGPETPIKLKLLLQGKPLSGVKISFIPRGITLKEGLDPEYERVTDAEGRVTFKPKLGGYYLIVAHHQTAEKGEGYESTNYTATLSLLVPEKCSCCDE